MPPPKAPPVADHVADGHQLPTAAMAHLFSARLPEAAAKPLRISQSRPWYGQWHYLHDVRGDEHAATPASATALPRPLHRRPTRPTTGGIPL
ncbi:hypothetical protein AURDEDRAFT_164779 [Auricularia subglabra TFB-10046 SS5]|nr:hypothetical protein AURDEDRAFT_164779 [Auricularia subglabra TFB-10046 SS5]